jgi:hypothetical protein
MFVHTKPRYAIKECLVLLDISRSRLYEEIKLGKLKTYSVRKRRYASPEALDAYVDLVKGEQI